MSERITLWAMSALSWVRELKDREDGQAAVEYGVLLALILALSITLIGTVGSKVSGAFQDIVDAL